MLFSPNRMSPRSRCADVPRPDQRVSALHPVQTGVMAYSPLVHCAVIRGTCDGC
jgi:hypothetical protein